MGKNYDLTGKRFCRLRVTALSHTKERGRKVWTCLCDCGNVTFATTETLNAGTKKSCGCLHKEHAATLKRSHGRSRTKTYRIWCGMVARCSIPSATGFAQYGGRGITVCQSWLTFDNFLADMGECPDGMSIERKNVDGNYEPRNCRWIPLPEQARNTTRSRTVRVNGVNRLARDVAVENGISVATFKARLYKFAWSLEQACGLEPRVKGATRT